MTTHNRILCYCMKRWPHLKRRDVSRLIRQVIKTEKSSVFERSREDLMFDVWLRVTQLYEARFD